MFNLSKIRSSEKIDSWNPKFNETLFLTKTLAFEHIYPSIKDRKVQAKFMWHASPDEDLSCQEENEIITKKNSR